MVELRLDAKRERENSNLSQRDQYVGPIFVWVDIARDFTGIPNHAAVAVAKNKGVIAAGGGMGGTQEKNHRNGFGISGISSAMFACL